MKPFVHILTGGPCWPRPVWPSAWPTFWRRNGPDRVKLCRNDRDELVGLVQYADVADTLFDPGLRHLVVAAEIAGDAFLRLTPDDTLKTAMLALKRHPEAPFLLVVAPDDRSKLVGIVSHSDLQAAQVQTSG